VDNELEVIRDEMELTRANLAEKLGALETQVRETVSDASEAVSSTVEGVKDVVSTVSETVESVTDTFNVSKHVEQHPWMAMGAAVATGFVLAQVIGRASSQPAPAPTPVPSPSLPRAPQAIAAAPRQAEQPAEQTKESGLWHSLESMLPDVGPVMHTLASSLGGLAVGSLMGVIRELAEHELPREWNGEVSKLIDQVTTQMGGKPLDSARSRQLFEALGLNGQQDGSRPQQPSGTRGVTGGRQPSQRL
jgi:ElaB/YqjD/DUF883 family membrane-anchored ribosome-binding protein